MIHMICFLLYSTLWYHIISKFIFSASFNFGLFSWLLPQPTTANPTTANPTPAPTTANPTANVSHSSSWYFSFLCAKVYHLIYILIGLVFQLLLQPTTAAPTTAQPTNAPTTAAPTPNPTSAAPTNEVRNFLQFSRSISFIHNFWLICLIAIFFDNIADTCTY